jgi:hypothetical protein
VKELISRNVGPAFISANPEFLNDDVCLCFHFCANARTPFLNKRRWFRSSNQLQTRAVGRR